jgi:hypothetical protein
MERRIVSGLLRSARFRGGFDFEKQLRQDRPHCSIMRHLLELLNIGAGDECSSCTYDDDCVDTVIVHRTHSRTAKALLYSSAEHIHRSV